ncbi:MAG: heavy metal translocating P-type ATPase [Pseudomonadota bacterium]
MTAACSACAAAPAALELADSTASVQLSVPSIRCAACIGTIEDHFRQMAGVREARVNATQKRVYIKSDLPDEMLVSALSDIGYQAFPLDQAALSGEKDPVGKDLILRMGVSGFAMMNVMLLSVAVWSGATDATRDMFHLISAAIALPTVIFSGRPFFVHAMQALRVGRMNMDVPISLSIILAVGMSLYESLNSGPHAYFDAALALTFFLLIGRYLEHRTKSAAHSAAAELAALEVHRADRKVGRRYENVPVSDLSVGDTVLVGSGVRVPADGALLSGEALTDRSFLTGESDPVSHSRDDTLCAGEINLGAPFELKIEAVGANTRLRRIAELVEMAENTRNSYTSLADKAARYYAPVVHILAAASFTGWMVATGDLRISINVAIAVLIITCPCALGLAVPAVSTAAISRLYHMGFLVKSGTALERLAEVSSVILDKTGTLTAPGFSFEADALNAEHSAIAKALAQQSSHPVSVALVQHLSDVEPATITDVLEVPGAGIEGTWEGQPVKLGRGSWLGSPGSELTLKVGENAIALPFAEKLLPGTQDMVRGLANRGLEPEILSGDNARKTARLAQKLGITHWHSNASPEEKARLVQELAALRGTCMVGDGINDTAALAYADVSIAPGKALDATRNAADIVMIGDALKDVPTLVSVARKSVRLSKENFGIAIVYNLIAVPIAMAGFATPLLAALAMSTSSITVLLNAMRVRT